MARLQLDGIFALRMQVELAPHQAVEGRPKGKRIAGEAGQTRP